MATRGILPGIIGGIAEGAIELGEDELAIRAENRRNAAAERVAEIKAKADIQKNKDKLKAEKDKKPPKTIKIKKTDPDSLEEFEETLEYNQETGTYAPIVREEDVAEYEGVLTQMYAKGGDPKKVSRDFKNQTGKDLPFGVADTVYKRYQSSVR